MFWARGWSEHRINAQIFLVKLLEKRQFGNKAELGV
jgi:hypothetical protein